MQRGKNDCYQWLSNSFLECTKFDFGRGSAADPAGGAYSAPTHPLASLGPTSKGRRGKGTGKGRRRRGREEGEEVWEGQERGKWKGRGRDARERGGKEMGREEEGKEGREEK